MISPYSENGEAPRALRNAWKQYWNISDFMQAISQVHQEIHRCGFITRQEYVS